MLPALPSAIPSGSVQGLVARGNVVIDIAVNDRDNTGSISTSVGKTYRVTL